jgi:hypothetical protein
VLLAGFGVADHPARKGGGEAGQGLGFLRKERNRPGQKEPDYGGLPPLLLETQVRGE